MPSGPKKRKAAKRRDQMKKQDSSSNPSPEPNHSSQENEKEKSLVEIEEDEGEEVFKTPRSQPEMPMFVFEPNSVYFSIGSVNNKMRNEIEGLSEVISKGLDLEMGFKDAEPIIAVDGLLMEREGNLEPVVFNEEMRHQFSSLNDNELKVYVNSEKRGDCLESWTYKDDEFLKETKLDFEMPIKDAKDDAGSKETELDEFVHVIKEESSIERVGKLGIGEDCPSIEQFVLSDEEMTPKASLEVDVSSSNEKEVKVVPWSDEELHTDNGDAGINVDVINYGKGGDDEGSKSLEREIDEDDLLVETTLDESGHDIEKQSMLETNDSLRSEEQSVPWDEETTPKASSEAVDVSTPNERVVKVMSWLLSDNGDGDVNVEEGLRSVEQSPPWDEEINHKALSGAVDVSLSNEREVKAVPWPDELFSDNGDADVIVDIVNYEKGGDDGNESLERQFNKDVLKETKLDECGHDIEKESKLQIEEGLRSVEQSAPWDEEMTHKGLSGVVDVSLSNEREAKAVPWPDEELLSDNGDADVNVDVVNPEKRVDNDLDECVDDIEKEEKLEIVQEHRSIESSVPFDEATFPWASIEAVDISLLKEKEMNMEISANLERGFQKDEGSQESNLVNFCQENKQPVPVPEKSKDLPAPDVDLANDKLGKSVEKSSIPVENQVLITEEATQGCKESHDISETLVGVNDAPFHGRVVETEELSPDTERTELLQRNEVGHSPLIVRRATLWNCCGLLEVLTSSDR